MEETVQESVDLAEALEEAKKEAAAEIAAEEAVVQPWYIRLRNLFCRTVKKIVTIVCSSVQSGILFILNNEQNQALAKLAVITAMKAGLKGDKAWAAAWSILQGGEIVIADGVTVKADQVATNVKETLLQLVYTLVKNKISVA